MSEELRNLNRNSTANTMSLLLRFVVAFASVPVLVRLLGVTGFGQWSLLQAFYSVALMAEFGLTSALTIRTAVERGARGPAHGEFVSGASLLLLTILGAVATIGWLGWTIVAGAGPAPFEGYRSCGILLAIAVMPRLWQQWLAGYEAGIENYTVQAKAETASLVILTGGYMVVAACGGRLVALCAWTAISAWLAIFVHLAFMRASGIALPRPRLAADEVRRVWSFAWRHWLYNIGGVLFTRADRFVVYAALGPKDLGIYAACVSVVSKINEVSALPIQPIAPALGAAWARGDNSLSRKIYQIAFRRSGAIVIVLTAGVVGLSRIITLVVVGSGTPVFTRLLVVMAVVYGIYSVAGAGHYVNLGLQQPGINAVVVLIASGLSLFSIWSLGTHFGIVGAGLGNGVFATYLVVNFYAAHSLGVRLSKALLDHCRVLVPLAGIGVLGWFTHARPGALLAGGALIALGVGVAAYIAKQDLGAMIGALRGRREIRQST